MVCEPDVETVRSVLGSRTGSPTSDTYGRAAQWVERFFVAFSSVAIAVIGFLAWVAIDYARNHLSKCQVCKGTGILKSTFFSHKYRPCPRCRRSGEVSHWS